MLKQQQSVILLELIFPDFLFSIPPFQSTSVLPENPIILDRWGRNINRTTIGPMEEGDDVILSCRVVGGKYNKQLFTPRFPLQSLFDAK